MNFSRTASHIERPAGQAAGANFAGTVLIVEDEDFVRGVAGEVLRFAGYQVLEARTAAEAARLFGQHRQDIQVLLTDVVLPGRNGQELAKELRVLNSGLRTIFVSGYPERITMQQGLLDANAIYLPKPFSAEALMRALRTVLEPVCSAKGARPLAKRACGSR